MKEMLLFAFDMNCVAHQSQGLWRHPRDRSSEYVNMNYWLDLARTLERGFFDGIFLADVSGLYDVYGGSSDAAIQAATQVPTNDPFTLVPLMASVTEQLTFGVTGNLSLESPYLFARRLSSLDHITDGRFGWNIVTGYLDSAHKATGEDAKEEHDVRYDIADEYMEVVYRLWEESWDVDAVRRDASTGTFADPSKVHEIIHEGQYFNVRGTHLCEPSPQRTPLLFQAGASSKGRAFAGKHAECVFIVGHSPKGQSEVVKQLHEQAVLNGRHSDDVKVIGGLSVIVGNSNSEAKEKFEDYQQYGSHTGALALLSGWSGMDLSLADDQKRIKEDKGDAIRGIYRHAGVTSMDDWVDRTTVGGAMEIIIGSPVSVVDQMQDWLDISGLDGFNLAYTVMPECVDDFVDLVVPELQNRGLLKTSYRPGTFREKLYGKGDYLVSPHPGSKYRR
ncbi:MAG: LLM class flavin-dependent oxidoreductase [Pseudomonadota bacterium]|nr:LLM class flavin-dependent oxidoreductase [Pseudomonadota bacterium]